MILEELYASLYEEYNKPREGIHVSDITLCPREAAFRKLDPKPLTNTDLNFFSSGRAIHEALQSLLRTNPDRYEVEKEVKFGDIIGHIDLFDKTNHIPIEAKSARVKTMEEPKAHYLKQLEAYMALTDSNKGVILVQCLLNYEDKPFLEFEHNMTDEQLDNTMKQLEEDSILLKSGIMNADPSIVRHINYDLTLNWKCKYCDYAKECEEMRVKENAGKFNQK